MKSVFAQYEKSANPGDHFEKLDALPADAPPFSDLKPIAYYLPQFHAIAENDEWWGKGFTEWTNVTKALPRYAGHLQPKMPADLGFYDLSHADTLRRQAELVRRSGIYGLCIHDYWFDGRKLLEKPLNLLLENPDIDLRFCLNWANETWSRRWDGTEQHVLLAQRYDPDRPDAYVRSILPAIRDARYIRVDGRPLIMIYRPALVPNPVAMFDSWRELLVREGEGDPFLMMAQSFDDADPRPYGLDAAAGFPPHNAGMFARNDRDRLKLLDRTYDGHVRSYTDLAERMLDLRGDGYPLFPGVCPGWDNEARKPKRGTSYYNSSPAAFEWWLRRAVKQADAAPGGDRFVFINAWNEWAEGAVLEPDRHYGAANLVAVRNVVDDYAAHQEMVAAPRPPGVVRPSVLNLFRNLPVRIVRRLWRMLAK